MAKLGALFGIEMRLFAFDVKAQRRSQILSLLLAY